MFECAEALYRGELWNAAQLKCGGKYDQERRIAMKIASQSHELFCPECGENLILCAGSIREPYFRHYDGSECVLADQERAGRYMRMLVCLTDIAERSFPQADIRRWGSVEGKRSQLLIRCGERRYAVNYVSESMKLTDLEKKIRLFEDCGITAIWFTPFKGCDRQVPTAAEYIISKSQKTLKSIRPADGLVYLKEYNKEGNALLFEDNYYLSDMRLDEDGEFLCDFWENAYAAERTQQCELESGRELAERFVSSLLQEEWKRNEEAVLRLETEQEALPQGAVYMENLKEYWLPLKLKGNSEDRRQAAEYRGLFLHFADHELAKRQGEERETFMAQVMAVLRVYRQARQWLD